MSAHHLLTQPYLTNQQKAPNTWQTAHLESFSLKIPTPSNGPGLSPPVTTTASSLTENELRDWVEQYALAMPQPHGHHWWQNVIKKSGTDWGSIPVDFLAQVHANPDAFKPAV